MKRKVLGKSPKRILDWDKNGKLIVKFPYDPTVITVIKKINGRIYNSENRTWSIPYLPSSIKLLVDSYGFSTSDRLKKKMFTQIIKEVENKRIPKLLRTPYPFQKLGIIDMIQKKGKVLLADDMGLGKTLQTIGWVAHKTNKKLPLIILCPASLKLNWKEELEKTLPNPPAICILNGVFKSENIPPISDIYILNFNIFANSFDTIITEEGKKIKVEIKGSGWADYLLSLNPKSIIIDEAHAIKNMDANRTRTILKFSKLKYKILLSGTPIEKRPVELWNLINFINPTLFKNYYSYVFRYCDAKKTDYGLDVKGSSNMGELHSILTNSIMIRRTKEQVGIELPEKIDTIIKVDIDNLKEYKQAEKSFKIWLTEKIAKKVTDMERQLALDLGNERKVEIIAEKVNKTLLAEVLVKIGVLKQLAAKGKINPLIEWLQNALNYDEKFVIFCTHSEPLNILYKKFKSISVKIDGSVDVTKRQAIVHAFQTNTKIKLLFGNMKAAGVGLTLTAASNVVILEYPDKPGEYTQAIDRINRIGQKSKSINVWNFIGNDTIENEVITALNEAQKVVKAILDGVDPEETILIANVINKYLLK